MLMQLKTTTTTTTTTTSVQRLGKMIRIEAGNSEA
jgi:hypothetical protein